MRIDRTRPDHLDALHGVLRATDLFPPDLLDGMIAPFLADPEGAALSPSVRRDGAPVGFCFCESEPLTVGTWNMRAIAILPPQQGRGLGRAIDGAGEAALAARGAQRLIVDTSGDAGFVPTRAVYRAAGYEGVARIQDFWDPGDDKVVF